MIQFFKRFLFTDTGKDTGIVLIGTLLNVAASGVFFILTPRILGPANFGLFSTVAVTGIMAASIANFGLDAGILRFAHKNSSIQNEIFSLALKSYLILGLAVAILGILLSGTVANFFNQPEISQLLRLAFLAVLTILLTNFFVAGLQSREQFAKAAVVNVSANITRVVILVFAAYFFTVGLYLVTAIFFFIPIMSVVVGKVFLPFKLVSTERALAEKFYKYNLWIAASLIIAAIPFDNYFLLKLAGPVQTGIYAAPFKLLASAYQFGGNFTRVLASRLATFNTVEKVIAFSKKVSLFIGVFVSGLIILIFIANFLIEILFGEAFGESVEIFKVLSAGFIFFFAATIPSALILYYLGQSKVAFIITLLRYLLFIVLLTLLVPVWQALGAAIAFSASEAFSFGLMTTYVFLKLKNR